MLPADGAQLGAQALQPLPHLLLLAGHHLELLLLQQLEGRRLLGGRLREELQHLLHALLGDRVQLLHLPSHLLACRPLLAQRYLEGRFLRLQLRLLLFEGFYLALVVELVFYVFNCFFLEDL